MIGGERLSTDNTLSRATIDLRKGKAVEAEAELRSILDANPEQFDALRLLGVACNQQGRHKEAIDCFQRALDVDAGSAVKNSPHPTRRFLGVCHHAPTSPVIMGLCFGLGAFSGGVRPCGLRDSRSCRLASSVKSWPSPGAIPVAGLVGIFFLHLMHRGGAVAVSLLVLWYL